MDYNKIRGAAMAYYANLSDEDQLKAWKFYKAIDTDGNGTISHNEYMSFLKKEGYRDYGLADPKNAFGMLDKNGDGVLNFEECITLFYIITVHHGATCCRGCLAYMWDIYFVCVECYVTGGVRYDLCCDCYRQKNFTHEHRLFRDNFHLLRCMQPTPKSASEVSTSRTIDSPSKREKIRKGVEDLKLGCEIWKIGSTVNDAANSCNTM